MDLVRGIVKIELARIAPRTIDQPKSWLTKKRGGVHRCGKIYGDLIAPRRFVELERRTVNRISELIALLDATGVHTRANNRKSTD